MAVKNVREMVVVPAYNEEAEIEEVVARIPKKFFVLVVDDGSTDATTEILRKIRGKRRNFAVITHETNLGSGAALKTGFEYALEKNFGKIFCLDADGQHLPAKLIQMSEVLESADAVFASRFRDEKNLSKMPFLRRNGNKLFTRLVNLFFKAGYSDVTCGMRGFTKKTLAKILPQLEEKSYGSALEIGCVCARENIRVKEISIPAIYLEKQENRSLAKLFFELSSALIKSFF